MEKNLFSLNPEQQLAVTSTSRFTQIIAGPGTGKTTTLAAKILYTQTELGVDTDKILGISFSRSAKSQLLNKLEEFTTILGYGGKPNILTFHSLAHKIIKNAIHYNESRFRENFSRIDTEEFIQLDPGLTKDLCTEYNDRELVNNVLSHAYNLVRQGSKSDKRALSHWNEIMQDDYFHIKTYSHGRIRILAKDLIKFWQRIYKIEKIKNVTDYQGLITEANRILSLKQVTYKKMTTLFEHIFVDEYQDTSLAQEELLFNLKNERTSITVVGDKNQTIYTFNGSNSENIDRFIETCNKISPTKIVQLKKNYRSTNEIVKLSNDFIKEDKIVVSEERIGYKPVAVETHSIELSAYYIAETINNLIKDTNFSYSDICILYRKNSEYSPQANKVIEQLKENGIPFNENKISNEQNQILIDMVLKVREDYEDEPLNEVISTLEKQGVSLELIQFITDCVKQGAYDTDDLIDFLVEIAESPSLGTQEQSVMVKTVHDAKGQEFPVVFVLYLGDGEFPHSSQPDLDEEKRLLYVALTRAKNELYILGQRGIVFESFLDKCLASEVNHIFFHSKIEEEKNEGFNALDKEIIDETTRQLKSDELARQKELRDLMNLF